MKTEDCKPLMRAWLHYNDKLTHVEFVGVLGGKVVYRDLATGKLDDHYPNQFHTSRQEAEKHGRDNAVATAKYHREQAEKYEAILKEPIAHEPVCMCIECVPTPIITDDDDDEGEDTTIYETGGEAFDDTPYGEKVAKTPTEEISLVQQVA